MENTGRQLEFCPSRRTYMPSPVDKKQENPAQHNENSLSCVFCNKTNLANNHILYQDDTNKILIIVNQRPYAPHFQVDHLVIIPMDHYTHLNELQEYHIKQEVELLKKLSAKLHNNAYTQEYQRNWGSMSGRSVDHLHSHFKNFILPPMSLPEAVIIARTYNTTIEDVIYRVREQLNKDSVDTVETPLLNETQKTCLCCLLGENENSNNTVDTTGIVKKFKYNYVCLAHYPITPGEICVIPYKHFSSIKDHSLECLTENMIIATALLPILRDYAQEHINDCDGGNIFIKNMGAKMEHNSHHVHTCVMPRTIIPLTPGAFDGNSAKLDLNPQHFFDHIKNACKTLLDK